MLVRELQSLCLDVELMKRQKPQAEEAADEAGAYYRLVAEPGSKSFRAPTRILQLGFCLRLAGEEENLVSQQPL